MIIEVVGAGGKTTRIFEKAREYRSQGKTVCILTTTKMYRREDTLIWEENAPKESLQKALDILGRSGICMCGTKAGEEKMGPIPDWALKDLSKAADVTLIEADGARSHALKYPRTGEPVLTGIAHEIWVMIGVYALGKPVEQMLHGYEQAREASFFDGETVTPGLLQKLIGYYKEIIKEKSPMSRCKVCPIGGNTLYERVLGAMLRDGMDLSVIRPEWFEQKARAVICGAGHVGQKTAQLMKFLGYETWVLDDRQEFLAKERFPDADKRICTPYNRIGEAFPEENAQDYYIVLTRGHEGDYACVREILKRKYAYLGMIGSRRKVAATMERLWEDGFSHEDTDQIHAPIGLAIGGQSPEEIAVSIAAQIVECANKSSQSAISKEQLSFQGKGCVCVIIEKEGSAPRAQGTLMIVTEEGIIGTVGGGSLEHQVVECAKVCAECCEQVYELSNEEGSALGMICGGRCRILFVPV